MNFENVRTPIPRVPSETNNSKKIPVDESTQIDENRESKLDFIFDKVF